jgi:cytochrome c oxidase subunit 4
MAHAHAADAAHPEQVGEHGEHHIIPIRTYLAVFTALMVLLIITLFAAYFDLGNWNLPIALTIAAAKVVLIVLYFMHVKFSSVLVKIFSGTTMLWLSILFMLTLADYFSRHWLPVAGK